MEIKTIKLSDGIEYRDIYQTIMAKLKSSGWYHVGSGAFANVYRKGKRVIKIVPDDDSYREYLKKVILKNQGNPFVPVVYQAVDYRDADNNLLMFCVEMEALDRIGNRTPEAVAQKYEEISDILDNLLLRRKVKIVDKHASKIVRGINKIVKSGCGLDFHRGNAMVRDKKQLVITDPVAW